MCRSAPGLCLSVGVAFLSGVDFSYDHHIGSELRAALHGAKPTSSHHLIVSLAEYYEWRITSAPIIAYFNILLLLVLPLAVFALVRDNYHTLVGRRAPVGRHMLDAESIVQLALVIGLTVTKAAPATARLIELVENGRAASLRNGGAPAPIDHSLMPLLTQLEAVHCAIFALNALQCFVPMLRWFYHCKQEATIRAEAATVLALENAAVAKQAKVAAATAANSAAAIATKLHHQQHGEDEEGTVTHTLTTTTITKRRKDGSIIDEHQ
jgi:hypothetical protein